MTTLGQLHEAIDALLHEHGADTPVLLVHQPRYPLAESVGGIYVDPGDEDATKEVRRHPIVFLVAGGESYEYGSPYGPRAAWEEMADF